MTNRVPGNQRPPHKGGRSLGVFMNALNALLIDQDGAPATEVGTTLRAEVPVENAPQATAAPSLNDQKGGPCIRRFGMTLKGVLRESPVPVASLPIERRVASQFICTGTRAQMRSSFM
jgi:hypothetical protein